MGGNVYLPVGKESHELNRAPNPNAQGGAIPNPDRPGTFLVNLVDDVNSEYALSGGDIEVGYQSHHVKGLTGYLAAYHFSHKDAPTVSGPRLSVRYDILQHLPQKPSWLGELTVLASVQHDAVRDTTWQAGIGLRIPLGKAPTQRATGLQKALTAVVRRDIDIVTTQAETLGGTPWMKADGTPYVGKLVTTADELRAVTAATGTASASTAAPLDTVAGIDIVGIANNITIDGIAYTDNTTEAAIVLNDGQRLTGGDLTIEVNGMTYEKLPIVTAPDVENSAATASAEAALATPAETSVFTLTLGQDANQNTGHLIRLSGNNTVEDIHLHVPDGTGDAAGIWNEGNTNSTISKNIFNGILSQQGEASGIRLEFADAGEAGADAQIATIKDNEFKKDVSGIAIKGKKAVRGIYFGRGLAAAGVVSGNKFENTVSTENIVYGFDFVKEMKGTVGSNEIISEASTTNQSAYGMYFRETLTEDDAGDITKNSLTVMASPVAKAIGISLKGGDTDAENALNGLEADKKNTFAGNIEDGNEVKVR